MSEEKNQDHFTCPEYSVEIRNALAESADNFNPSAKSKKSSKEKTKPQ